MTLVESVPTCPDCGKETICLCCWETAGQREGRCSWAPCGCPDETGTESE